MQGAQMTIGQANVAAARVELRGLTDKGQSGRSNTITSPLLRAARELADWVRTPGAAVEHLTDGVQLPRTFFGNLRGDEMAMVLEAMAVFLRAEGVAPQAISPRPGLPAEGVVDGINCAFAIVYSYRIPPADGRSGCGERGSVVAARTAARDLSRLSDGEFCKVLRGVFAALAGMFLPGSHGEVWLQHPLADLAAIIEPFITEATDRGIRGEALRSAIGNHAQLTAFLSTSDMLEPVFYGFRVPLDSHRRILGSAFDVGPPGGG